MADKKPPEKTGSFSLSDFFKIKPAEKKPVTTPKPADKPPSSLMDMFKTDPTIKWLTDNIKFYRELGFFADTGRMSAKQLSEQIKKRLPKKAGPSRDFDGLDIVLVDTKRVWKMAPVDLSRDTNFWMRMMDEWTRISRGILRPIKVDVENNHDTGKQTLIQFHQDAQIFSMYVKTGNGVWLDYNVFRQLNEIFAESGFTFEQSDLPDGSKVVVVVTKSEKQKLIKEKNWKFVE